MYKNDISHFYTFCLSYLPLMVKATVPSFVNTDRNSFTRLYGSVEEVVKMCLVYKIWRLLCSCPLLSTPPPPQKKILYLDSLSKFTC